MSAGWKSSKSTSKKKSKKKWKNTRIKNPYGMLPIGRQIRHYTLGAGKIVAFEKGSGYPVVEYSGGFREIYPPQDFAYGFVWPVRFEGHSKEAMESRARKLRNRHRGKQPSNYTRNHPAPKKKAGMSEVAKADMAAQAKRDMLSLKVDEPIRTEEDVIREEAKRADERQELIKSGNMTPSTVARNKTTRACSTCAYFHSPDFCNAMAVCGKWMPAHGATYTKVK